MATRSKKVSFHPVIPTITDNTMMDSNTQQTKNVENNANTEIPNDVPIKGNTFGRKILIGVLVSVIVVLVLLLIYQIYKYYKTPEAPNNLIKPRQTTAQTTTQMTTQSKTSNFTKPKSSTSSVNEGKFGGTSYIPPSVKKTKANIPSYVEKMSTDQLMDAMQLDKKGEDIAVPNNLAREVMEMNKVTPANEDERLSTLIDNVRSNSTQQTPGLEPIPEREDINAELRKEIQEETARYDKMKEQSIEMEDVLDGFDETDEPQTVSEPEPEVINKCNHILKTGKNKGNECGKSAVGSDKCPKHRS
jgi:hypothetical protein